MRRTDREMDEGFGLEVMDKADFAVMSMNGDEGRPYSIPLTPGRVGRSVYFHCALQGKKIDLIRRDPRVRLVFVGPVEVPPPMTDQEYSTFKEQGTLKLNITKKFTTYFESAIADGTAHIIEDPAEKTAGLRAICERYTPGNMKYFDEAIDASLGRTCVIRVDLESITAKRKWKSE